jgi:hypothetical protein
VFLPLLTFYDVFYFVGCKVWLRDEGAGLIFFSLIRVVVRCLWLYEGAQGLVADANGFERGHAGDGRILLDEDVLEA